MEDGGEKGDVMRDSGKTLEESNIQSIGRIHQVKVRRKREALILKLKRKYLQSPKGIYITRG